MTDVLWLSSLHICPALSRHESLHAQTKLRSSVRIISLPELVRLKNLNATYFDKTSYLLSGWNSLQLGLWTNSFSGRSRWTSSPLPIQSPPPNSCHFTRTPSLSMAHAGKLNSKFRAFSPAEIILSPPLNFLTPARPVLQTRCWEV